MVFDSPRWLLVATLALAGTAVSQEICVQVPDSVFDANETNSFPFGNGDPANFTANMIYQTMVMSADLKDSSSNPITTGTITKIGFAPVGEGTHSFEKLIIRMDQTTATTLSTTFGSNLTANAKTTTLDNFDWNHGKDQFEDLTVTPFEYDSSKGNLVIEIFTVNTTFSSTVTASSPLFYKGVMPRVYNMHTGTAPATGFADTSGLKIQVCFAGEQPDPMAELVDAVEALVDNTTLSAAQGAFLTSQLASAQAYIDNEQFAAATLQLRIFQLSVAAYVVFNILSLEQGTSLINGAEAVINSF